MSVCLQVAQENKYRTIFKYVPFTENGMWLFIPI